MCVFIDKVTLYSIFCCTHREAALCSTARCQWAQTSYFFSHRNLLTQALKASVTAVGSEQAEEIHDTQKAALVIFCFVLFLGVQFFRCMDFGVFFTCTCTHQGTVCLWRVSTGDVWGIQSNLQVLGHVCCLWLAGHVVPG